MAINHFTAAKQACEIVYMVYILVMSSLKYTSSLLGRIEEEMKPHLFLTLLISTSRFSWFSSSLQQEYEYFMYTI